MSVPATYRSGTPRTQSRGTAGRVARWHSHLRGLATAIHAISELDEDEQDGGAKVWGEVQVLDVSSFFLSVVLNILWERLSSRDLVVGLMGDQGRKTTHVTIFAEKNL
jgi:hypothetical protein